MIGESPNNIFIIRYTAPMLKITTEIILSFLCSPIHRKTYPVTDYRFLELIPMEL